MLCFTNSVLNQVWGTLQVYLTPCIPKCHPKMNDEEEEMNNMFQTNLKFSETSNEC
jgi:hypothetical protein